MSNKRHPRKKRGSRRTKANRGAEKRAEDRSFGSGLDEVGFRPLGRRIAVSRRSTADGTKTGSEPQTELPTPNEYPELADPLGYDTGDPSWVRKAAEHALSSADKEAIEK